MWISEATTNTFITSKHSCFPSSQSYENRRLKKQTHCGKNTNKAWNPVQAGSLRDRKPKGCRVSELLLTHPCFCSKSLYFHFSFWLPWCWCKTSGFRIDLEFLTSTVPLPCPRTSPFDFDLFYSELRSILRILLNTGSRDCHNWWKKSWDKNLFAIPGAHLHPPLNFVTSAQDWLYPDVDNHMCCLLLR